MKLKEYLYSCAGKIRYLTICITIRDWLIVLETLPIMLAPKIYLYTSEMIHHCGASWSKQQTDLSLHKAGFVTH